MAISDTLVESFLDVFFLLLTVILSEYQRFSYRKGYIEEFV